MKFLKPTILIISITILFTACASKVQTHVVESEKENVSTLLKKLIKKEQEINKLNQKIEDCKETQKSK
ncbi:MULTISPECIES: hypothetical protein [Arcobacteraceae]|uniref:Lipoprotein n=1 Tax=Poseidonibacter parvus TaxID=1850254 RepID=A0A1P8KIR3_9BACT|nr:MULTISPECIES: hypothetical protein [Arcobacteraceae]APW64414.1 hypothetical protein LPB137_00485 [Poseidonibacter parvus]